MKVAFVQSLPIMLDSYLVLSACLKEKGIKSEVFISALEKDICNEVIKSGAKLIGINTLTGSYDWALRFAKKIKKIKNIPIVLGGCHPTHYPETIDLTAIDYICIGEGEYAIVDLAETIREGGGAANIKNIAYKTNGELIINQPRPIVKDLNSLPFSNREIYHKFDYFRKLSIYNYRGSRCCPYSCTFCAMKNLSDLYKGQKLYRELSPGYIIEELSNIKKDYKNLRAVFFSDEIFGLNKKWAYELLDEYKKKINLPYTVSTRANLLDDNFIRLLKETGCDMLSMSIETANQELRANVLNKKISNHDLIEAGKKLHKLGIKTRVNCIFCLPDETLKDAFDNVQLMKQMKATDPVGFLLQPFPKTGVYNYALKKGYINKDEMKFDDLDPLVYFRTPMNIPNKEKIIIVQELFVYASKVPFFDKLLRVLIYLPNNFIYKLLHKIGIAFSHKSFYKLSFFGLIKYLFSARKLDTTRS